MKLLLLGAGVIGGEGMRVLQHLLDLDLEGLPKEVELTIADLNVDRAQELADSLDGYKKVTAMQLDITDTDNLTEVAKDFDLVLNAVGPFVRFGVPTLKAVIASGTNYIDVCDEGDTTEDLLDLFDEAKEAGVTALINMGQAPGILNLQAKYIADKLDEVDTLKVVWHSGPPNVDLVRGTDLEESMQYIFDFEDDVTGEKFIEFSPACWDHLVHSATGQIPIWKDGKRAMVEAFDSGEYFDFSGDIGRVPVYLFGHPEPITLPRYIDIKDYSACLGTLKSDPAIRKAARGHEDPVHPPVEPDAPLYEMPDAWKDLGAFQGQAAIAEGTEDGKRVRYTSRWLQSVFDRGVYAYGGNPIGIYLMYKHKDNFPKGVFAPEGLIDTEEFFNVLVKLTNSMHDWDMSFEELLPIQREVLE